MEIGACSVAITDHDANTENEIPLYMEPVDSELAAIICGDAAVGKNVWLRCDVNAHFTDSFDILDVVDNIRTAFDLGVSPRFEVDDVPDLDWVLHVQSSWKPCVIGGFILRFPWHTDEDVKISVEKFGAAPVSDFQELLLEGGIAFGTGEHPTTQLCLEWITTLLKEDENVETFLDYGAGSGVLGMAACKLKSDSLQAVGIEIDLDAINIANENAVKNGVQMKNYMPRQLGSDDESASLIMKAMQRAKVEFLPEEMDGPRFDACAANILAGPLCSLAETIANMLRPGARLGLSGILEWQGEDVVEAYIEYFDDVKVEKEKGGWVLVTGIRKSS
jgi:ribosomal protein L11 methyltransferase|eukprot:scaffold7488_cov240-Chaetoceros_neogracile.AAC.3